MRLKMECLDQTILQKMEDTTGYNRHRIAYEVSNDPTSPLCREYLRRWYAAQGYTCKIVGGAS